MATFFGQDDGVARYGVRGDSDVNTGVLGNSSSGNAVQGISGSGIGVQGLSNGSAAVYGEALARGNGVEGRSPSGNGVLADSINGTGMRASSDSGPGVHGSSNSDVGVYGESTSGAGVDGFSSTAIGVLGISVQRTGVFGLSNGTGIIGWGGSQAGLFIGDVDVTGSLTKGGGGFAIDHPVDPAHKYLHHSFVESPDMKNVYDGVAICDQRGEVTVELPDWFEALNTDFRYQLTPVGAPAQNLFIATEIKDNRFTIGGGTPGLKVCWQVTGIRHDAWANANRIIVEKDKSPDERGYYRHAKAHGLREDRGINRAHHDDARKHLQRRPAGAP